MPARSCSMSRVGFAPSLLMGSLLFWEEGAGVSGVGDVGMVWATVRKKSSMYWSEWGSYLRDFRRQ